MTSMIVPHCSDIPLPAAMMKRRLILAIILAPFAVCSAAARVPCKLTALGPAKATNARDGRTLLLDDGRELRLAAIEAGDDSRDALQALAAGRTLRLEKLGDKKENEQDRYGRLVAFAYIEDSQQSLQPCWSAVLPASRRGPAPKPVPRRY